MRSRRVDEFLNLVYSGVCEFVRWRTDELISFLSLLLRKLCVLFLRRLCVCALMSSCVFEVMN